ncbi:unnamed protein product [Cunninghamella echinulata]
MAFVSFLYNNNSNDHTPQKDTEITEEEKLKIVESIKESLNEINIHFTNEHIMQFLVANSWNKEAAKQHIISSMEWREKEKIDYWPVATKYNKLPLLVSVRGYKYIQDANTDYHPGLSESSIRILNYMGGDCFHKFDKEGHPILIDRTGYHQSKEIGINVNDEELKNYQVSCNEFLSRVLFPEATERAGRYIHKETIIFDCEHMGLFQFHMAGLNKMKQVLAYLQSYYPETLHHLFVVNAPSAFLIMWKVIKPWLDQRTLDKVHILGKDYKDCLLKYIDSDSLPDFLGGSCTCKHMQGGCVPSIIKGTIPTLKITNDNEKVSTSYNSDIMDQARQNKSLRNLV